MTKRLLDAAERLADVAVTSVEYSDWPELREAIKEVNAAVEEGRKIGFGIEPAIWMFAIRFLAQVNDCLPARVSSEEDDGTIIISLTWRKGDCALLMVISDDGEADYSIIRNPGDQFATDVKSFKLDDGAPSEIETFLRTYFSLNQTRQ